MYRRIKITTQIGSSEFTQGSIHDALIDCNNSAVVVGVDADIKVITSGAYKIMPPPDKSDSLMALQPKQIILVFE